MIGLTRRQFGLAAMAVSLVDAGAVAQPAVPTVRLPDGTLVPALGQGSARLAGGRHPASEAEEALRTGISLGMTLLDTAETYGNGDSEQMIGRATADGIRGACMASLARLATNYLDLYLLHWRTGVRDLSVVVQTFESLRAERHIRRWGVSNFDVADMEDLFRVHGGDACATNQVVYNLADRRMERGLIAWCDSHAIPIMAYSPLGRGGELLQNTGLGRVAQRHQSSPAAVALAWTIRSGHAVAIPESGSSAHVRENASAMSLRLTEADLDELNRAFS
jgi:diketogulonate reductase-like aldo/keto reductase